MIRNNNLRLVLAVSLVALCYKSSVVAEDNLPDRFQDAYFGALISDALCLGSHYEYDAPKNNAAYGGCSISTYMAPGKQMGGQMHSVRWVVRNYHFGTTKGDQTDCGECNVLVLEHLALTADDPHPFSVKEFIPPNGKSGSLQGGSNGHALKPSRRISR